MSPNCRIELKNLTFQLLNSSKLRCNTTVQNDDLTVGSGLKNYRHRSRRTRREIVHKWSSRIMGAGRHEDKGEERGEELPLERILLL
jgi:hypothetical protein